MFTSGRVERNSRALHIAYFSLAAYDSFPENNITTSFPTQMPLVFCSTTRGEIHFPFRLYYSQQNLTRANLTFSCFKIASIYKFVSVYCLQDFELKMSFQLHNNPLPDKTLSIFLLIMRLFLIINSYFPPKPTRSCAHFLVCKSNLLISFILRCSMLLSRIYAMSSESRLM